jgi:hypothetical protein
VGHRAGLDGCGKSRPYRVSIPGPSSPYRVATPTELSRPIDLQIRLRNNRKNQEVIGSVQSGIRKETAALKVSQ